MRKEKGRVGHAWRENLSATLTRRRASNYRERGDEKTLHGVDKKIFREEKPTI
jgi:hypothetical protein